MPKISAGLLLFRRARGELQVLLVHPGGPFWAKKDAAAWSIPKGEVDAGEDFLAAARREFTEETGLSLPPDDAAFRLLQPVKQKGGKVVHAFALEVGEDFDISNFRSNTFTMVWPPSSGREQEFPEIDRAEWFALHEARDKLLVGQFELLQQLRELIR